jgi:hypothetical protein
MSINQNNASVVTTCNQRLKALGKFVATKTQMSVNGKQVKPADVAAIYQTALDTRTVLVQHRTTYEQALVARDDAENARLALDKGLKAWVSSQFGADSQEAFEFGFSSPKVGAKTAETKAQAVQKLLATRQARRTMGKRQKAKIKGTVQAPTAPAEPAMTVPAATPAASSTNGVAGPH